MIRAQELMPSVAELEQPGSHRKHRPIVTARQSLTFAQRGVRKTMRAPEALIGVSLQPVLALPLFVVLFGRALSGSTHSYLQYLVPAVLVQTMMLASMGIGVALNIDIKAGIFDRFRSLPISRAAPLIGAVLADLPRYAIAVASTLAVGSVLGFRLQTNPLLAAAGFLLVILFALCFCWLPVLIGVTARSTSAVPAMMLPLTFIATFASNGFTNDASVPSWMAAVLDGNPVSQLNSAVRGLTIGGPIIQPLGSTLAWMAALLGIFAPLAIRAYRRRC